MNIFKRIPLAFFILALLMHAFSANISKATLPVGNGIRLCSIGYLPDVAKEATVVGAASGITSFRLVDTKTGAVVYEGTLGAPRESRVTNEVARIADFSAFGKTGTYLLKIDGLPDSEPFSISKNAVDNSLQVVMLGFHGQRCGQAVSLDWQGQTFSHGPCHTAPSKLDYYDKSLAGQTKDATGGWHDAGDYGRYAVNSAFTCAILMEAWERNGRNLEKLNLPIPEHGKSKLPDFLAELKYNLDWHLKLQMDDGRVVHRVSTKRFGGMVLPESDSNETFFSPVCRLSTIDFAAMGCMAARVYEKYDPVYAQKWRDAAKKAWIAVRGMPVDSKPDLSGFEMGVYLTEPQSDTLWALIELRMTFGDEFLTDIERVKFHDAIDDDNRVFAVTWDWGRGYNIGLYDYIFSKDARDNPEILARLQKDLVGAADLIMENRATHVYGRGIRVYYWGCNGAVVRTSMNLQAAYLVTGNKKYLDAAYDQIAYVYGRNPFSRSFVTGDGLNPPMFPHHRPSAGDNIVDPWPGHLVGGANPKETDWFDEMPSFRTNEFAINWDASLAYALSIFYRGDK